MGKRRVNNFLYNLKLWFISTRTATCNCIYIKDFKVHWKPGTLIQIDMSDIIVDEPTLIECDECHCKMVLSNYGVAKL